MTTEQKIDAAVNRERDKLIEDGVRPHHAPIVAAWNLMAAMREIAAKNADRT